MIFKEFPKTRVCIIDFQPLLQDAIKETVIACRDYNIPTKGKGSTDVQKFLYHFCLEKFCDGYSNTNSKFNKVIAVYNQNKYKVVTDTFLKKILNVLPVPWCICTSLQSPDLEMAAVSAFENYKAKNKKLNNFANKNSLHSLIKKSHNKKLFSGGTVDLSLQPE